MRVNLTQPPFTADNRKKTIETILKGKINLPAYLTPDARDLIRRLMKRQVSQRLGSGIADAEAIKSHQFFKLVNWDDVINRRLEPPIKPVLVSASTPLHRLSSTETNDYCVSLNIFRKVKTMCHSSTQSSPNSLQSIHPSLMYSAKVLTNNLS